MKYEKPTITRMSLMPSKVLTYAWGCKGTDYTCGSTNYCACGDFAACSGAEIGS